MDINQVFKYALKLELIAKNPMEHVVIQKDISELIHDESNDTTENFWKKETVKKFLSILEKDYPLKDYMLFHPLLVTGGRKCEVLALKWSDIHFEANTITFNKTLYFEKGIYTLQTPKSRKSRQTIIIGDETLALLKKWREEDEKNSGIPTTDNHFFFKRIDERPIRIVYVNEQLHKIIHKYGLPPVTVHGLRHTHASLLFEAGVSIKEVQERLGHTDITMTMNTYTHLSKRILENTAVRFENYFNK